MKTKVLLLTIFFTTAIIGIGQNSNTNTYSRYEGTIDSTIQVTANIIRLDNNLSGNYNYYNPGNDSNDAYSKSIPLTGELVDNNFSLNSYGKSDLILSGMMLQGSLDGNWYYKENTVFPFKVSESYPDGSIPMNVYYLHSEDKLNKNDKDSPVADIELTLIYPDSDKKSQVIDSVCHHIAKAFFGDNFYDSIPDTMMTRFENEYYNNYINQNLSRYQTGASFNWQKIVSMSVVNNSNYLLCVEFLKYAFSGGAHGMTNISYLNIDLFNGNDIQYGDIFKEGSEEELGRILTKQLYIVKQIPEDISLKEAGYFVENIEPNHNIFINNTGIGFLYNSYEIAPYSFGQTSIFINYEQLKHLIKSKSPVSNILK